MADIQALEEALIGLNLMMVVDPKDNDMTGETAVQFGEVMDTNDPVFTELQNHPVHVDKIYSHDEMRLEHDDAQDYQNEKREQY